MKKLTADYGDDAYTLLLTDQEAQKVANKESFTKISEVWREITDDKDDPEIQATWRYHPEQDYFSIERDDGAVFNAYKYFIE